MAIERITDYATVSRYVYDAGYCTYEHGWAHVDTKKEAWYFGLWTNPGKREIYSACDGNLCLTKCGTDDEYRREVTRISKENGYWIGVDPGTSPVMMSAFLSLGMGDLMAFTTTLGRLGREAAQSSIDSHGFLVSPDVAWQFMRDLYESDDAVDHQEAREEMLMHESPPIEFVAAYCKYA